MVGGSGEQGLQGENRNKVIFLPGGEEGETQHGRVNGEGRSVGAGPGLGAPPADAQASRSSSRPPS